MGLFPCLSNEQLLLITAGDPKSGPMFPSMCSPKCPSSAYVMLGGQVAVGVIFEKHYGLLSTDLPLKVNEHKAPTPTGAFEMSGTLNAAWLV